jgi:hypothetical protein
LTISKRITVCIWQNFTFTPLSQPFLTPDDKKMSMESQDALVVIEGKKVRRTWNNSEWWFVLEDIVYILTDSSDPKQYIQKMKQRDEPLAKGWVQIVHTLTVDSARTA